MKLNNSLKSVKHPKRINPKLSDSTHDHDEQLRSGTDLHVDRKIAKRQRREMFIDLTYP